LQEHTDISKFALKPAEQTFQANEHQGPAILIDQSMIWSNYAVDDEAIQKQ